MKNKKYTFKTLFHKYHKVLLFVILFVVSLGVTLYFASAAAGDDNKYEVKDVKITAITDGTAPFDTSDQAGNDLNESNGKVRTYDTVSYTISYSLVAKQGVTLEDTTVDRTINLEFLIPAVVSGKVTTQGSTSDLSPIFGGYSYAKVSFTVSPSDGANGHITVNLYDISAANGTNINPKIYMSENTDMSVTLIENLPDDKKSSFDNAKTIIGENPNTCEIDSCSTSVSAKESYIVNLFSGSNEKSDSITTFKIGYMVGLKQNGEKGIKGQYIPSSVSFTVDALINNMPVIPSLTELTYNDSVNQVISDSLYMCETCTNDPLITVPYGDGENGEVEITNKNNRGNIRFGISKIKNSYVPLSSSSEYYAFSTGMLYLQSDRKQTQLGDLSISLSTDRNDSNSIVLDDSQARQIGAYKSSINISDKGLLQEDTLQEGLNKDPGKAITAYGDDFMLETNFEYGYSGGDALNSFTNYVKVDNSAIKLTNFNKSDDSNTSIDAYLMNGDNYIRPDEVSGVKFYYGEWNSNYFKIKSGAPSGCPSTLPSTKEEIMNLYGGPCIEKTLALKYANHIIIKGEGYEGDISEELYEKGPIIVETYFNSTEPFPNSFNGRVLLKGSVKEDATLINTEHQIVTSATGEFSENEGGSSSPYYLSNEKNTDGTSLISNPENYKKTVYNYTEKTVTTEHSNICGTTECAINGATIIVAAAKAAPPTITPSYNGKNNNFYYFPIQWDVIPSVTKKSTTSKYSLVEVDVYLPHYLTLTNSEAIIDINKDGQVGTRSIPIEPISIEEISHSSLNNIRSTEDTGNEDVNYIKYKYAINLLEGDLANTTPMIRLFTNIKLNTPKNFRFYSYVTSNYYILTDYPSGDTIIQREFQTIEPISERSNRNNNNEIYIHNDSNITTQGTSTPRYLEKNESYTYKMQAYNNTENAISNVSLYYVLPYEGDSAYEDLQSKFAATDFKVKFKSLPEGFSNSYDVYYTTGGENNSGKKANIISNELSSTSGDSNSWVEWNDLTTEISNITAIKVTLKSSNALAPKSYFAGEDGITIEVTPIGSDVGDVYYNQFHIITGTTNKTNYFSSRDKVSIYNRTISGFVWEDYDYDGLAGEEESRLENIPVSLYKISDSLDNIDANDPSTFVGKEGEEWVSDTTTDSNGSYAFYGLTEGKYYAKFTYDDKKYSITKRDASNPDNTPATNKNSKARSYNGGVAISSIVTFDAVNNSSYNNLNLGLSIRKEFVVDIKNYIKNVTITSDSGTESHDYDKATTVSINLKNTNNKHARVTYDFVLENTKYFPGYVGLIQDVLPQDMTFNANYKENQDWVFTGGVLYYTGLSGKLLVPNEKHYFSLVLDLDIAEGGNYINFVSLDNLVLMGDEVPQFDFNIIDDGGNQEQTQDQTPTETPSTNGEGE